MDRPQPEFVQPPDLQALPVVYEQLAKVALSHLHESGEVAPQVLVMSVPPGARTPAAGMALDPRLVSLFHRDAGGKTQMMALIRAILDPANSIHRAVVDQLGASPNLIAHISEAWYVTGPSAGAAYDEHASLSEHPQRQEGVFVALHSMRGTHIGTCPFSRDSAGKPNAEFRPLDLRSPELQGRFNINSSAEELEIEPGRTEPPPAGSERRQH